MEKSTAYILFLFYLTYTKDLSFYVHLKMQSFLCYMIICGLWSEKLLGLNNKNL